MTESEKVDFAELLTMLGEIYQKQLSKKVLRLYWMVLKGFSLEQIEQAVEHIASTHVYATMPKPADFVQFLNPSEKLEIQVAEAFKTVEEYMELYGHPTSVCFDDPLIHHVIDLMGGWVRICDETQRMDDKEYGFWRREFGAHYRAYLIAPPKRPVPQLIGAHEAHNRANGYLDENDMLRLPNGEKQPANFIQPFIHGDKQLEDKVLSKPRLIRSGLVEEENGEAN